MGREAEEIINGKCYPDDPESCFLSLPVNQKVQYIDFSAGSGNHAIVSPIGSFAVGVDFFGDGSFYLVDAPGHIAGHLVAIARVSANRFVLLAGDCCHNRQCYNPGERRISELNYHKIETARQTVEKVKAMHQSDNAVVILAHEKERLHEMPIFPKKLNDWVKEEIGRKLSKGS